MRSRLEEAFQTSRFHSFLGSLKGVSDEAARWMPEQYRGFPHMDGSILNLAFHTGGDKHVLISYSFGDASITWPLMQRRFDSYGGDLAAARRLAEEGHALVLSTLDDVGESGLDSKRSYFGGKTLVAYE